MSKILEQFGKYILLEKLAAGGMAEVFLAKFFGAEGVNKFFAIKKILPQFSDNQEFIEMFREEAKIAINMKHNNVVSIYEFGEEARQFYLVMDFVEGYNLRQILNQIKKAKTNFSIEHIIYIVKEVAAGLDHAHRCIDTATNKPLNIIHRDMSPQNIMISFEGEIKVVDFGIAKAANHDERTKVGTLKGKFGYMSPEQAEGMGEIDNRTDIFSLGIVLWELLANDRLFTGDSEAILIRKLIDCQVPPIREKVPSIPPELERIVSKALTKDKSLRYQKASDMQRDLNRFLNTNFPDFSAHDFSVFMKTIFSPEILELKKKLVEYAKISSSDSKSNANNALSSQTATDRVVSSASKSEQARVSAEKPAAQIPKATNTPNSGKARIPSDNINNFEVPKTKDRANTDSKSPRSQSTSNSESQGLNQQTLIGIESGNSGDTVRRRRPVSPNTKTGTHNMSDYTFPQENRSWTGPIFLTFMIIASGLGYVYLKKGAVNMQTLMAVLGKNSDSGSMEDASTSVNRPNLKSQIEEPAAVEEKYVVSIQSSPSGAQIFVNGTATELTTPAQISVAANKEFTLGLKRDGYFPYETKLNANENALSHRATLQESIKTAYISLSVINGGPVPIVTINGQRLLEKLPLKSYAIPAGVPVIIKASNPFSKLSAEQTVFMTSNERKSIELVLGIKRK